MAEGSLNRFDCNRLNVTLTDLFLYDQLMTDVLVDFGIFGYLNLISDLQVKKLEAHL